MIPPNERLSRSRPYRRRSAIIRGYNCLRNAATQDIEDCMLLGYNTNGFAHHAPEDALQVLAEIGYRAVAMTIDHGVLNPRDPRLGDQPGRLRRVAKKLGLTLVIETGARFLLDPRRKHEPTFVSATAERRATRLAFIQQAVDVAREVDATCVSLWSGVLHDVVSSDEAWDRLVGGLSEALAHAHRNAMRLAFEPEPGMLVDTLAAYRELRERLEAAGAATEALRLTIDVGHLHCLDETPIADQIDRHADELANVHIEDMVRGVHRHLPFGEGEIEFGPVLSALGAARDDLPVCVELSRHSHIAPEAARQAFEFLNSPRWA